MNGITRHSLRTVLAMCGAGALAACGAAPALVTSATPVGAQTTTTQVMVRVTSHDAKIIGTGVGGARVTIRDAQSGAVLAEGIQEGGTGDTSLIMGARERGGSVFDTDGAAGFLAELELGAPTWVEITAEGPLGTPHALRRVSSTALLVPGRDVLGDGIILELLGFTVELRQPETGSALPAGEPVDVLARVTMLCGCPTSPGGIWDSDRYEIVARVLQDGTVKSETPLAYAGETSMHTGTVPALEPGEVTIEVLSMDDERGNFGIARETFTVR